MSRSGQGNYVWVQPVMACQKLEFWHSMAVRFLCRQQCIRISTTLHSRFLR
jgi:hypothetical protein